MRPLVSEYFKLRHDLDRLGYWNEFSDVVHRDGTTQGVQVDHCELILPSSDCFLFLPYDFTRRKYRCHTHPTGERFLRSNSFEC
jgi:hypothetical protein